MKSRWIIIILVAGAHLALLLTVTITTARQESREDTTVFKLVDAQEIAPPPEPEPEPAPEPDPEEPPPPPQEQITEEVVETEEPVDVAPQPVEEPPPTPTPPKEPEYLPQHRISVAPGIPTEEIRSRIEYPALARSQGIEGVVYLELFIDSDGTIRKIEVLREPGFGMGDAAKAAFEGISATPARANDEVVAVRYRYPIRFQLN